MNKKKSILSDGVKMSLLSIVFGLLVTGIVLWVAGYNPFQVYNVIIKGIFGRPKYISYTIIKATPLILTGLSVGFAFKTGLFNIGAEGQFIMGTIAASMAGYFLSLPFGIHPIVAILIAGLAGAVWGAIAGALKARFGIHEVISTIMLNWIALYAHNAAINIPGFFQRTNKAHHIANTASIVVMESFKKSKEGRAWLMQHPALRDIFKTPMNYGFIIAIVIAIIVWFILNKTTLGFSLRAVGQNKYAAEYGGINVNKNIIASMGISGMISGLAGGLMVTGVSKGITTIAAMEGYGFDGIAVALMGNSSPIGSIFSGLLFGGLKYGGGKIQAPPVNAPTEVINIMIGTIILFIAIPRIIVLLKRTFNRKGVN